MTHADLVARGLRWLRTTQRCPITFAEFRTVIPFEPDVIGWRHSGHQCLLVEAKVSRSDFHRDKHKIGHKAGLLPGCFRWYLTPKGLLQADEAPEGWGLLEVRGKRIHTIVKAPRVESCARTEIAMLASAVRRHTIGVQWHHDTARFEPAKM